ncbi:MAG TPA: GAF domain-containing SpoIIE family protein phosphatase [Vicinamibacterales bacterium]|nr:GAF domain-containing SpoIIE family protein phosphatase [Vicinamibacterales bacterium]
MARITLKQILAAQGGLRPVLESLAGATGWPIAVSDASGGPLLGTTSAGNRFSVAHDGRELGWVSGEAGGAVIADLLSFLAAKEAERKALGAEVLHLYREVNLIYSFSEKLAALLDLEKVASLTLQEARHLIVATDGVILLLDESTGALNTIAAFGDELPRLGGFERGRGIAGAVAASGVGEIVNDVSGDVRRVNVVVDVQSLVCAPLKVGEKVIGVIVLASTLPMAYEARELKLLNTLALQTATAIENARLFERTVVAARERERLLALNKAAEVARAGYERELELAAGIQANLFPAQLPHLPGYDLAARNRAARRCGGDYYDAIATGPERVLLCVADVSGKGIPAALLMSHMQATLRALLGRADTLPELASQAHALLHTSTSANKYVTAALLELHLQSGRATYVSAGHIDSLLVKQDSGVVPLRSTGAPLGLLPPGLPYESTDVIVAENDTMILYSDGVPDAQNASGEEFGEARLLAIVQECRHEPASIMADTIFSAIDAFAGAAPQFDDITLMVLRRLHA